MKPSSKTILNVLYLLSWIIFVGLCIEAGGFMTNAAFTWVLSPVGARHVWQEVDLSDLYKYDRGYFFVAELLMGIVAIMKACMFYLIIKVLGGKNLNLAQPFNKAMKRFISKIAYLSFLIGLCSWWGDAYAAWFVEQGVRMPDIKAMQLGGADVWLFMGVILVVIAQVFKRGIEIQTENELTV